MKEPSQYVQQLKDVQDEARMSKVIKDIQEDARADVVAVLEAWSHDMHLPSLRPCPTCEEASKAAKIRLGCCAYQDQQPKT